MDNINQDFYNLAIELDELRLKILKLVEGPAGEKLHSMDASRLEADAGDMVQTRDRLLDGAGEYAEKAFSIYRFDRAKKELREFKARLIEGLNPLLEMKLKALVAVDRVPYDAQEGFTYRGSNEVFFTKSDTWIRTEKGTYRGVKI